MSVWLKNYFVYIEIYNYLYFNKVFYIVHKKKTFTTLLFIKINIFFFKFFIILYRLRFYVIFVYGYTFN